MSGSRILAFDVGTSGVKAVVTEGARLIASNVRPYGVRSGSDGWVEQDIGMIQRAMGRASRAAIAAAGGGPPIAAISITAQMFNLQPADEHGDPILPMMSWLDIRASERAARLAVEVDPEEQYRLLGSVVTAKDVLPKILWLRDECPALYASTRWLLDCKEALVLRLTGVAVTDPTGASVFRLVEPGTGRWSDPACRRLGVDRRRLPEVRPASSIAGGLLPAAARELGVPPGTPVLVGAGDVPTSQVGAGAIGVGDAHLSLGTAVYLGIITARPVEDPTRRLGVLAHVTDDRWILWLEIATGGGALSWLMRALERRRVDYAEVDRIVEACADDMGELLCAPWLSGERVPVFDDALRAAFIGLELRHGRAHLIRAVMEGVACQIRWAIEFAEAYGEPVGEIRAVGGGAIGSAWAQIIADIMGRDLVAVAEPQDAGARAAAALALVAIGEEPDLAFMREATRTERTYHPSPARRDRSDRTYRRYRRMYEALAPLYHADAEPVGAVMT
jgi:sugar (pentulose or hexulose) kinase